MLANAPPGLAQCTNAVCFVQEDVRLPSMHFVNAGQSRASETLGWAGQARGLANKQTDRHARNLRPVMAKSGSAGVQGLPVIPATELRLGAPKPGLPVQVGPQTPAAAERTQYLVLLSHPDDLLELAGLTLHAENALSYHQHLAPSPTAARLALGNCSAQHHFKAASIIVRKHLHGTISRLCAGQQGLAVVGCLSEAAMRLHAIAGNAMRGSHGRERYRCSVLPPHRKWSCLLSIHACP